MAEIATCEVKERLRSIYRSTDVELIRSACLARVSVVDAQVAAAKAEIAGPPIKEERPPIGEASADEVAEGLTQARLALANDQRMLPHG